MKNIYFKEPITEEYVRLYTHLANLFFEESKVRQPMTGDYQVSIEVEEREGHYVGKATLQTTENKYETTYEEKIEQQWLSEKHQVKRVKSRLFLQLLEEETGMTQSWGVLTGIRPMKLYHQHMQKLGDREQVHELLRKQYRISEDKIELLAEIERVQLRALPDLYDLKKEVSVYIGIPFCPTKCAYCTFPAYAIHRKNNRVDNFLDALHLEVEAIGKWLTEHDVRITSIYFGGGTPTSIEAHEMDALYEKVYNSFPNMDKVREITVEAGRPDTITEEKLAVLNKWKIDRISVNPQSFTNATLKAIGRHHSVEETIEKFHLAREHGMNNINMDLIIGLPNEDETHYAHSLAETEKLMPESVTMHTLSFKRASHMSQNKEKYKVADRKTTERMMQMGVDWAKEHEYIPYYMYRQKNILGNLENVGYSKFGEESLYNIVIMEEAQTIIGLGSGATSKFMKHGSRKLQQYMNPKDPASYALTIDQSIEEKIDWLNKIVK
ncbi:coproporphyrinogen III oxidase [Savagea faecisuis]|uniref:Coproporphyrinogen III oxidase n=1 Tax=Savagea faecisuis TaxID=1274803 RepID=A0ABW3GXF1_9BACL